MDFWRLLNSLNAIRVAYILIKNVLPRTPVPRPQHAPHGFDRVYAEPLAERRLFNERKKMKNERKKARRILFACNCQERKRSRLKSRARNKEGGQLDSPINGRRGMLRAASATPALSASLAGRRFYPPNLADAKGNDGREGRKNRSSEAR